MERHSEDRNGRSLFEGKLGKWYIIIYFFIKIQDMVLLCSYVTTLGQVYVFLQKKKNLILSTMLERSPWITRFVLLTYRGSTSCSVGLIAKPLV